jgi:NADH:ubiquinone oxidoreductase subunit 6 (subunit J)
MSRHLLLLQADTPAAGPGFLGEYGPAFVVPAALGLAAVYLLLPRVRRYPPLWGGLLAGLAVVVAGWWLIHFEAATAEAVLFYAFAGIAIVSAGMLVTQHNPVYAALAFAMVVLSTCGIFLLLAAPFLAAATVIIYAGAIIVTFLFVIMLAQQLGLSSADLRSREPFLASLAGFVLLAALLGVLQHTYRDTTNPEDRARDLNELNALIDQTSKAKEAASVEEMGKILGNERAFNIRVSTVGGEREEPQPLKKSRARLTDAAAAAEVAWIKPTELQPPEEKLAKMRRALAEMEVELRFLHGRLLLPGTVAATPDKELPRSPYGTGFPGGTTKGAEGRRQLPAENVAAIGRSLFTDYLLAFEIVGFLLLVATIGAIAIAARRTEGLR